MASAYWHTPNKSGLGTGASWRPRSIGKYIYARAREARRAGAPIGHPVDGGRGVSSVAAGWAVYAPSKIGRLRRSTSETMNTVTDAVQREYEALYLNRNALRHVAKTSLHRVAVPVADVLDEAFLALWRDVAEKGVDGSLADHVCAYINRAGWKLARRALKLGQHEQSYGLDASTVEEEAALLDPTPYLAMTPARDRFAAAFDNAVRSLSPKQREAFILTQLRGATQHEASEILGISQRSVSERVARATDAIRETLTEEDAL